MRLRSLLRRQVSAPMIISTVALFVALGGVGWAAVSLPASSVGTAQLRNNSVTGSKIPPLAVGFRKIQLGAVGTKRIDSSQVQIRVRGNCSTSGGAIKSIDSGGKVQCGSTPPQELGTSSPAATLGSGTTAIATKPLAAGSSYLVLAYPHASISANAGQQVTVNCTLSVSSSTAATLTRSLKVEIGAGSQAGTIPLAVPAPSSATAPAATVGCSEVHTGAANPNVSVASTINAIQTASNG
jgi:hypothetical protein